MIAQLIVLVCLLFAGALSATTNVSAASPTVKPIHSVPVLFQDGEPYSMLHPLIGSSTQGVQYQYRRYRSIKTIAYSKDGKTIAIAFGNRIRLWDLSNGMQRTELVGHEDQIISVIFSPDGTMVGSSSADGTVRLWDTTTGVQRRQLIDHTWLDSTPQKKIAVAFSPDGKIIASTSAANTVRLWNAATGQPLLQLRGHTDSVASVVFSPDGKTIASASIDNNILLWDAVTGEQRATLSEAGRTVTYSPDGKTIIGIIGSLIHLWDAASGKELTRINTGPSIGFSPANLIFDPQVADIDISPDGKTIVSASSDQQIELWDAATGQWRARLDCATSQVESVAFSPDGYTLACAFADGSAELWDVATGKQYLGLGTRSAYVFSAIFSPDGKTVASTSGDKSIRLWDTASGKQHTQFNDQTIPVFSSIVFSPDGRIIAGVSGDSSIRLLDVTTGKLHSKLDGHTGPVHSVVYSPDGKTIVSASGDNSIRLWDSTSGKQRSKLDGHTGPVRIVACSPDGKTIASASRDKSIRLWDASTGKQRAKLDSHTSSITSITFSPDSKTVAGASYGFSSLSSKLDDNSVYLWDAATGRQSAKLKGCSGDITTVAFSPDGKTIAGASDDNSVCFWDIATGNQRAQIKGHSALITSLAFSPDGKTLASASFDNSIRLWDAESRRDVGVMVLGSGGRWASCRTPDKPCWRFEDGSLLNTIYAAGEVHPLKLAGRPQTLSIRLAPDAAKSGIAGNTINIPVLVRNTGTGRAFWLRLETAKSPIAGKWVLETETLPFLDAGQEATLVATLHLHADGTNPAPTEADIRLVVTQTHSVPTAVPTAHISIQSPKLMIQDARWLRNGDTQAIVVKIENTGTAIKKAAFSLRGDGLPDLAPAELAVDGLPAGQTRNLSFALPSNLRPASIRLSLTGMTLQGAEDKGFPLYNWSFSDVPASPPGLPWMLYGAGLFALALAISYQLIFRHPMVLHLNANPFNLLELDPGHIGGAIKALDQARKRAAVLEATQVHPSWLALVQKLGSDAPEVRAHALAERLGLKLTPVAENDGAQWELILSADFPLNVARVKLCVPDANRAAADVLNALRLTNEVTLILGASIDQRAALAYKAKEHGGLLVAPNGAELTGLMLSANPLDTLSRLIARNVPVTQISPYQTGAGVHRQALFFGRGALLAQILGREPANYLVVGGRQVGKSSLLKEIERLYRKDQEVDCHYLPLNNQDGIRSIAENLGAETKTLEGVLGHLRAVTGHRTLLLIDEADAFVDADRSKNYAVLQQLRALSETGQAHFILAGFWALYRQATVDYQSPLKNFGSVLTVGELEIEACRLLATEPMARLGIGWESAELVERLIKLTGQRANLISIACSAALHALGQTEKTIRTFHLEAALRSPSIRNALLGWSELGNDATECRLDRITVYSTVGHDNFTLTDVLKTLNASAFHPEVEQIKASLARLELAFILARSNNQYRYQVPLQRDLILADDVDWLLKDELRAAKSS